MNLIHFLTRANAARNIMKDPKKAGREAVWGVIQGYLIMVSIWITVPLILVGLLGFGSVLGGPYEFFAGLFYFLVSAMLVVAVSAFVTYRKIRHSWKELKEDFNKSKAQPITEVDVIEAEVVEK